VFNSNYFPKLTELNLSMNLFTRTRMIGELSTLRILILNSNKLETLLYPTDLIIKKGLNGVMVIHYFSII
jgi:hypothetical protein